jgi:hypothetical protein
MVHNPHTIGDIKPHDKNPVTDDDANYHSEPHAPYQDRTVLCSTYASVSDLCMAHASACTPPLSQHTSISDWVYVTCLCLHTSCFTG